MVTAAQLNADAPIKASAPRLTGRPLGSKDETEALVTEGSNSSERSKSAIGSLFRGTA